MRDLVPVMAMILTATAATGCGSAREVRDATSHANAWGCDQCHGYPPPPFFPADAALTHPTDLTPAMCSVCHPRTVQPDGHTIVAGGEHRDGQVEAIDYKTVSCDSCHDVLPTTGRHAYHRIQRGVACTTCHRDFDPDTRTADDSVHMQGRPYIVVATGAQITRESEDGVWPESECSACHDALGVGKD
jgi:hypothetical protein